MPDKDYQKEESMSREYICSHCGIPAESEHQLLIHLDMRHKYESKDYQSKIDSIIWGGMNKERQVIALTNLVAEERQKERDSIADAIDKLEVEHTVKFGDVLKWSEVTDVLASQRNKPSEEEMK